MAISLNVELQTPERSACDVIVRAAPGFHSQELHIDTDEGNAANVQGTVMARNLYSKVVIWDERFEKVHNTLQEFFDLVES